MSNNQSAQQAQKRAKNIKNRLSLRTPQAQSLELLHRIATDVDLHTASIQQIIEVIKTQRSRYEWSDFAFASMCFALATWVGKTRLMWAMIYYLYKAVGIKNFFVVAPNLTIYNKLREDFRYGSKKYVFKGLADVDGNNPIVVDGDNYLNVNHTMQQWFDFRTSDQFVINVFNIDKFNSKKEKGKFYDMSEYIWSSYAEYLKNLWDLVLLMDESHRYRAKTSMKSLESLEPVLWLEFTATPFTVSGSKKKEFKNVAYAYNLANAIQDGYVKTPWVATRENYDASSKTQDELDFDKISDGLQIHEATKAELQAYADNHNVPRVKPFLMISAKDQKHADRLEERIKNEILWGRYADKVVKIYSGGKKSEFDEAIGKLLEVEKPENSIEVVIQVMMLKEWWDVNNLYTIVPLRASASEILTEQTIGRGLRLPYGERTGDSVVDRLTIVSHDKYAEVVNAARKDDSLVKNVINLDDEEQFSPLTQIQASTPVYLDSQSAIEKNALAQEILQEWTASYEHVEQVQQMIQEEAVEYIASVEIATPEDLQSEHHQQEIQKRITSRLASVWVKLQEKPLRLVLDALAQEKKQKYISQWVTDLTKSFIQHTIQVPRVDFDYGESKVTFDTSYRIKNHFITWLLLQESKILMQSLVDNAIERQEAIQQINFQWSVKDYLVMMMMDLWDLLYDEYADWMYQIASDCEEALHETFPDAWDDLLKYQLYTYRSLFMSEISNQIRSPEVKQIQRWEPTITVREWVKIIQWSTYTHRPDGLLDLRDTNFEKRKIKQLVFTWFTRSVDRFVKFDSDSERIFAIILENESIPLKWVKPNDKYFNIYYNTNQKYLPDFVVETDTMMYMIEPKASNMMQDESVLAKMESAKLRIDAVNKHWSGKKRQYVLVPHDQIQEHQTLEYIVSIGRK